MPTTTLTFGEVAENGPGMQKLGRMAAEGLTFAELAHAKWRFEAAGCRCELIGLIGAAGVEELGGEDGPEEAYVLVVRRGAAALAAAAGGAAALAAEQRRLVPDKKALFYGKVRNKLARWNLTFGDAAQEPDYATGRGRVVPFGELPALAAARAALPAFFGPRAAGLRAEGNYYAPSCGIGFHGDGERRIVIAIRLGATMPLLRLRGGTCVASRRATGSRSSSPTATCTRCPERPSAPTGAAPRSRRCATPRARRSTSRRSRGAALFGSAALTLNRASSSGGNCRTKLKRAAVRIRMLRFWLAVLLAALLAGADALPDRRWVEPAWREFAVGGPAWRAAVARGEAVARLTPPTRKTAPASRGRRRLSAHHPESRPNAARVPPAAVAAVAAAAVAVAAVARVASPRTAGPEPRPRGAP